MWSLTLNRYDDLWKRRENDARAHLRRFLSTPFSVVGGTGCRKSSLKICSKRALRQTKCHEILQLVPCKVCCKLLPVILHETHRSLPANFWDEQKQYTVLLMKGFKVCVSGGCIACTNQLLELIVEPALKCFTFIKYSDYGLMEIFIGREWDSLIYQRNKWLRNEVGHILRWCSDQRTPSFLLKRAYRE